MRLVWTSFVAVKISCGGLTRRGQAGGRPLKGCSWGTGDTAAASAERRDNGP